MKLNTKYKKTANSLSYSETSGGCAFPDDGVGLTRLSQIADGRRRRNDRAAAAAEVPQGDVDSLTPACLDDPRALRATALGGVGHRAADVAAS